MKLEQLTVEAFLSIYAPAVLESPFYKEYFMTLRWPSSPVTSFISHLKERGFFCIVYGAKNVRSFLSVFEKHFNIKMTYIPDENKFIVNET